jgi:hypothetical protein
VIEVRTFSGKMNYDDNPYRLPKGDYSDALNITRDAQGDSQDEVVSNILGNQLIEDVLPDGTNKVIGNYADKVRNRQYYFTWNDEGYNRISYYDGTTDSVVIVMEDLTDTDNVGVLNFDPSYRINHIDIVYRDEQGDLLFWTDGLNPPSKINVKTATTGAYGIIQRSYIDVAKEPPSAPPYCVYEDDASVTVNNLNNKQFKFKYRFVYDDLEKSVTSAQSIVPIPIKYSDQSVSTDPTKNADIFIAFQTGEANVTKIELLASESLGTTFSDYFLISVIDKAELNLNNNDVSYYRFYNNQAYNSIPLNESLQPFDLVPQKAYTQSLPNGNVLDYGAITEGYDLTIPEFSVTNLTSIPAVEYRNGLLVLAYQEEQPAFGSGNIKIIVAGIPSAVTISTEITITTLIGTFPAQTPLTISATALSTDSISTILSNLSASAISNGYSIISTYSNELIIGGISSTLDTVLISDMYYDLPSANSKLAYDWTSKYNYGVVYFDSKGRTNSVITSLDSVASTEYYQEDTITVSPGNDIVSPLLPKQRFIIRNRPPEWATYFEIVRTKNLTKSNFLYWISERTYKDSIVNDSGYQYAYISINNLTQYISSNPQVKNLGYEFTPGDRIRFVKLYTSSGATNTIYDSNNSKDFEILESATNPTINGVVVTGQVLKIYLPTTSSTFNFGTDIYANYLIEIYTPAPNFANQLNLYYEFGQRYIIGDAGTNEAYHEGMIQNQTPDLSNYAIFDFYEGDSYFRYRSIPTGGKMSWTHSPVSGITSNFNSFYLLATLVSNTSNNPNYTPQDVTTTTGFVTTSYPLIINSPSNPPSFRIRGTMRLKSSVNFSNIQLVNNEWNGISGGGSIQIVGTKVFANTGTLVSGQEKTILIDAIYTPSVGMTRVGWGLNNFKGDLLDLNIDITDAKIIYQGIIDSNFSDNISSSASVNGRAWKVDPNAEQSFNPTLIRFGGEFQAGTTVNDINRFYEENFDVYDRSRGSIQKMFIEGRNQYVFQQFDVGVVTVLTQIVRDTAGNPLSAQSDKLLNKIVYPYIGGYGIGNVPESFAYGKHAKFFVDNNKGVVCRLSTDGITPISILYKMNAFFVPLLANYNSNLNTTIPETGTPTVYGAYDAFTNKYIICMSEISREDYTQNAVTVSFLDSRDSKEGFESFYSYQPENIGALNNLLLTFKDGQIWKHDNPIHCNFYGIDYDVHIDAIFNDAPLDKKTYLAIMQTSNTLWHCSAILSQATTGGSPQVTYIVPARFSLLEGQYNAAIPRDINSPGGLINGDTMKGNYLKVRFQTSNGDGLYYLNSVSLKYINSPLNVR